MAEHSSVAAALVGLALVLAAASGCGMTVLRALHTESDSPAERFVMGSAIGLGLLAYAVLAAGLLGFLHPPVLLALVLIEAALGAPTLLAWMRSPGDRIHHGDTEPRKGRKIGTLPLGYPRQRVISVVKNPSCCAALALVLVCLLLMAVTLVGALAPPNGDDWDSLTYHLAAPKLYLAHGRIFFIPYDSHTNFPFTLEMLYTLGLVYGGAAGAKLFHWAAGWLTALGIAAFCRRLRVPHPASLGTRRADRRAPVPTDGDGMRMPIWAPPLAAALFLSIPQVQWQATTAYIDLGTTLYQFLALAAFVYAVAGSGGSTDRKSTCGWLIVSGLMCGWAMGTKMTALLPFGLLVLAGIFWAGVQAFRRSGVQAFNSPDLQADEGRPVLDPVGPERPNARTPERLNRWRSIAVLVVTGGLVASPWYVKSYLWTHNPVYPFFYSFFPHSVGWTREAEIAYQHEQQFFGLGHGVKALLMAPWNLAMQGWAYFTVPTRHALPGTLPYFDGLRRGGLSATFLGLVPLALYTRRWDRRLTGLIVYALALLLPWFALSQQSRYLLPITAPLAVVAAAVVANLEADLPRWAAGAFVGLVLCLHARWGWNEILQRTWPVVSGQISQQEYLQRTFAPYEAMRYINTLPANTKVALYQETRGFYLDRDYLWANPLQNTLIPYEQLQSGAALVRFLKTHLGVTHVLINTAGLEGTEKTPWRILLQDAIDRGDLVPVFAAHGVEVYAIP